MRRLTSLGFILLLLTTLTVPVYAQSAEDDEALSDTESKVDSILQDTTGDEADATESTSDSDSTPSDTPTGILGDSSDKGFTGTYSDEDPESPAYKEKKLFGDDEAPDEEDEEGGDVVDNATHVLKMEFDTRVVITDTRSAYSYLEINYTTKMEQEIQVGNRRFRTRGKANIMTDIVGTLAGNELFTCELDIKISDADVDMMVRHSEVEESEELDASSSLAVQLKFNKQDLLEDWFSNCLGVDGSQFNTKGEQEKYLFTALEAIDPSLSGILVEEYDPLVESTVDLETPPILIEDLDSYEEILIEGNGEIVIEPLGGE